MRAVELPPPLAEVLTRIGRGTRPADARKLSERYRAGVASDTGHAVRSDAELAAYATVRFPATYAAAVAACSAVAAAEPGFVPAAVLDIGAGLGATTCAVLTVWPTVSSVTCLEPDSRAVAAGRLVVAAVAGAVPVTWVTGGVDAMAGRRADLVTAGYVGNEVADPTAFAHAAWAATEAVLLLLEPGRWEESHALLRAREALLAAGARTVAPCPHDNRCPLPRSDWCHFGQRLPRSAAHRHAKGGDLPYEDEKFSYVALSRHPATPTAGRVIRRPTRRKGLVELRVCGTDALGDVRVGRSDPRYRAAKDVGWGDAWPTG